MNPVIQAKLALIKLDQTIFLCRSCEPAQHDQGCSVCNKICEAIKELEKCE